MNNKEDENLTFVYLVKEIEGSTVITAYWDQQDALDAVVKLNEAEKKTRWEFQGLIIHGEREQ